VTAIEAPTEGKEIECHVSYEVVTADNGVDGLERALEGGFDLILHDMLMPRVSRIEMLREPHEIAECAMIHRAPGSAPRAFRTAH
jgi:CheY-like chemotaxis protein